jgi:hypothetical protein
MKPVVLWRLIREIKNPCLRRRNSPQEKVFGAVETRITPTHNGPAKPFERKEEDDK